MDNYRYLRREHAFKNEFNLCAGNSYAFTKFISNADKTILQENILQYHTFICKKTDINRESEICRKYNTAGINMYILPHYDMDEFFDEFSEKGALQSGYHLFAMTERRFKELFDNYLYVANELETKIVFEEHEFPNLHFINVSNMMRVHLLLKNPKFMKSLK